jgi:hypothetical protein
MNPAPSTVSLLSLLLVACTQPTELEPTGSGGSSGETSSAAGGSDPGSTSSSGGAGIGGEAAGGGSTTNATTGAGAGEPCPDGITCVSTFPFTDERDTSAEGTSSIASYDCAPSTNEGGREIVYRVAIPSAGFLSAAVYDAAGVDLDVHILSDFDPSAPSGNGCLSRGDKQAKADVEPGYAYVVADSWTNSSGTALEGAYRLDIGFVPVSEGPCDFEPVDIARVGDNGQSLSLPATGPIVREAHLVTQAEPAPFPATSTDELDAHYALSQAETGLVMYREQVWAPLEGGDFYGAGIGDPADFPVEHEGWYVNMYWTAGSRPVRGTRMILRLPGDPSRAVVVAAGYETGPGDLAMIGGTTEETHFYLGTQHQDEMTLGLAADPTLPLGPRRCTDMP